MPTIVSKLDAADYLKTPEQIAAFLAEVSIGGDSDLLRMAVEAVARAERTASAPRSLK
jgi:DNA-binding phage protein